MLVTTLVALVAVATPGAGAAVKALDPKSLILQPADLPLTFAVKNSKPHGPNEQVAMYLRPEILGAPALPSGGLFGIMANLAVAPSVADAEQSFVARGGLSAASIRDDLAPKTSATANIGVEELTLDVKQPDVAAGFRVRYELEGKTVVEYRYRLLSGRVVANLIVGGRAGDGGKEPADLAGHASHVLHAQLARIRAAFPGKT